MEANEVLSIVEWALSGIGVIGVSAFAWLHHQHLVLERRIDQVERASERLDPLRKALEEASFNQAQNMAKGVRP